MRLYKQREMRFNLRYGLLSLIIFGIEVCIATIWKDIFLLRAYIGDVLVVMLLYTAILSFFNIKNKGTLLIYIFLFSVLVEVAQYFKLATLLGFKEGSIMYIVIGNSFSWLDILCYFIGVLLMYLGLGSKLYAVGSKQ